MTVSIRLSAADVAEPLRLEPVAGPPTDALVVRPEAPVTLGRSSLCEAPLSDPAVSRRHARVYRQSGAWVIADLGSRHGTTLNGVRLEPDAPAPLREGDVIGIGPWVFRVGGDRGSLMLSTVDAGRVERAVSSPGESLARQRLSLLLDAAAALHASESEATLWSAVLSALLTGTGYQHGAVIRAASAEGGIELVAQQGAGRTGSFSRSLLRAASQGDVVRLSGDVPAAHSLVSAGAQDALCAPILVDRVVAAYVYLQQSRELASAGQAVDFCHAVARLAGLALANLNRRELDRRRRELEADLGAAREAQSLIMPPERGEVGGLRYAVKMTPGRLVAGDLFDALDLGSGRSAIVLGDVSSKGAGAGIMMATAQAHLNASLRLHADAARAVADVNRHLCRCVGAGRFVSMWVGVFDAGAGRVTYVDAGHGHWLLARAGGTAERVAHEGALVVGIEPDAGYPAETLEMGPGDRLVLFSDGVIEQPDADGRQFGLDRVIALLGGAREPADDVADVFRAVESFAPGARLSDDTTVASMVWASSSAR